MFHRSQKNQKKQLVMPHQTIGVTTLQADGDGDILHAIAIGKYLSKYGYNVVYQPSIFYHINNGVAAIKHFIAAGLAQDKEYSGETLEEYSADVFLQNPHLHIVGFSSYEPTDDFLEEKSYEEKMVEGMQCFGDKFPFVDLWLHVSVSVPNKFFTARNHFYITEHGGSADAWDENKIKTIEMGIGETKYSERELYRRADSYIIDNRYCGILLNYNTKKTPKQKLEVGLSISDPVFKLALFGSEQKSDSCRRILERTLVISCYFPKDLSYHDESQKGFLQMICKAFKYSSYEKILMVTNRVPKLKASEFKSCDFHIKVVEPDLDENESDSEFEDNAEKQKTLKIIQSINPKQPNEFIILQKNFMSRPDYEKLISASHLAIPAGDNTLQEAIANHVLILPFIKLNTKDKFYIAFANEIKKISPMVSAYLKNIYDLQEIVEGGKEGDAHKLMSEIVNSLKQRKLFDEWDKVCDYLFKNWNLYDKLVPLVEDNFKSYRQELFGDSREHDNFFDERIEYKSQRLTMNPDYQSIYCDKLDDPSHPFSYTFFSSSFMASMRKLAVLPEFSTFSNPLDEIVAEEAAKETLKRKRNDSEFAADVTQISKRRALGNGNGVK